MDHQLTTPRTAFSGKLDTGKALTLRAKQRSVLRITQGRVWATLSHADADSRVLAGDHFLSQGQRLTLLPGQELVMESFESSASSHPATAYFSWETPGVAANALRDPQPERRAVGMGVLQPRRDGRHALGLVAGACGRLVRGLAHGAAIAPRALRNALAILFVAICDRIYGANRSFGSTKKTAARPARRGAH